MDIIRVYFNGSDGKAKDFSFACPTWYHKPKIISAMAYRLQFVCNQEFLFATSSKYGCSQFPIKQSRSFPVHGFSFSYYKQGLPFFVPEFNEYARFDKFEKTNFFVYDEILKCEFPDLCIDNVAPFPCAFPY